jgi:ubiquinone/menaquinone biosynthesis C-methylase UbiE
LEAYLSKFLKIEGIPALGAKLYSLIAGKSPILKDLYKEVAEEVSLRISSGRILDVGTGPGYLPLEIAGRSRGLEITGIDVSPAMVRLANINAQKTGSSQRVKFLLANAAGLPFEDAYFDFVISTLSLHHWRKPGECIKEIHRVLKEDGEAWIYDIRRDTPKDVDAQVKKKYGRFLSFCFLNIIRKHSSVTLKEIEEILSSTGIVFSKKRIEEKGVLLKLRLLK